MTEGERIILLAGGNALYAFDPGDERVAIQRMVIDVAYPGEGTLVSEIDAERLDEVLAAIRQEGDIEFCDFRGGRSRSNEEGK